ncbi:MAG: oxidoreductase [Planctomycetota bacterium]|nr:oxidoreductase [Planctomycetota bacterium]
MAKPKVAVYWSAACGGCDVKVLDTNEKILDIAAAVDLLFWPIALDFKYKDVEEMADREIDLCIINGGIRNSEQEHIVKLLRRKSKVVAALGACAISGGIPALANLYDAQSILDYVYHKTTSIDNFQGPLPQPEYDAPEGRLTIPKFYDSVFALDQMIDVQYYIPGCPPPPSLIVKALTAFLQGTLPPPPATVAGEGSVCDECPRERNREAKVKKWKRIAQFTPPADTKKCLLDEGFFCLGPATQAGCEALCIKANIPCEGCMGKPQGVTDRGSKMLSYIASLTDASTEEEAKKILNDVVDQAGLLYRFDLPKSLIGGRRKE